MPIPKAIANYHCHNAEVPIWHSREQCLYWSDIPTGRMFRYEPATNRHEQIYQGAMIGGITIQQDGSLLQFQANGAIARWQAGQQQVLIPEIPAERGNRFNDCIADPAGRVFAGTMSTPDRPGRLYRLDLDGRLSIVLDNVGISNGMGFTPNHQQMYYTDSAKRTIYLFDYDVATGTLSDQRVWVTTPENEGVPDGLTVDAAGYIWSARWDGGHLFRYAPDGTEVLRIPFPAPKVSCVTFGGVDYTDLYVTTAGGDNPDTEGLDAGALFQLNLGIRGVPEFFSRLNISQSGIYFQD